MAMRTVAAVIVAVTLAACGGGGEWATSGSAPAAAAGASAATVEQYAGLVAGHEGEWREGVANIHDTCAYSHAVDLCAAAYLNASEQAETLHVALSAAHDPRMPGEATVRRVPRCGPC
jgi:hypothetical protein